MPPPEWGDDPLPEDEALLRRAYEAFNSRDIDAALALMHPGVDWPNAIEGGRVHGREGVRDYWARQFEHSDPHVEAERFSVDQNGLIVASVHQVVRDHQGEVVVDQRVEHAYRLRDGLVGYMEVRGG